MKGAVVAAAAAMAGGASAHAHGHRHAHELFAQKRAGEVCVPGCTTIYTHVYGEPTLIPNKPAATPVYEANTWVATPLPETTPCPIPTPEPVSCPTPGTYTFTATTVTLTESTTVCAAESTSVPAGTHTCGGVTTVVDTATTVTCPYATVITEGETTTSTILTTEYVCPSAGTYTIAPIVTTVTEDTVVVYPVPTSYAPGTYTAPEQTITVTETDFVTYCPYTSAGLPTPEVEIPVETPVAVVPTYVAPEVEAPVVTPVAVVPTYVAPEAEATPEAPVYEAPKPETEYEAPKPETKPAPQPEYEAPEASPAPEAQPEYETPKVETKPAPEAETSNDTIYLGEKGDHYGITYTPYDSKTGNCKTAAQVDSDIATLKSEGFQVVRTYSTDCDTLKTVGPACKKHGVDMIVGVFVKDTGCTYECPDIKEQIDALSSWAQWDMVKLFVVGNEAIMNGFCSAEELSKLISTVKSKCSAYKGPYTIAETLDVWQRPEVASTLCSAVDITGANVHPYFNPNTTPEMAGDFVAGQLDILGKICPGNEVVNLECGWPTAGTCNGVACPGKDEQYTAIQSIREKCGDKTVFFSYEDDRWKEPGACQCEQSWGTKGCFN